METYLFYITHLIMTACIAVMILIGWPESTHFFIKRGLVLASSISLPKKSKAICYSFHKEHVGVKALFINLLSIGLQITTQLLK